jgi:hypothetical protein
MVNEFLSCRDVIVIAALFYPVFFCLNGSSSRAVREGQDREPKKSTGIAHDVVVQGRKTKFSVASTLKRRRRGRAIDCESPTCGFETETNIT